MKAKTGRSDLLIKLSAPPDEPVGAGVPPMIRKPILATKLSALPDEPAGAAQ